MLKSIDWSQSTSPLTTVNPSSAHNETKIKFVGSDHIKIIHYPIAERCISLLTIANLLGQQGEYP